MRKGDIFVYPRALNPIQKYYVEELYENEMGEWMVIVSWEDLEKETGWDRSCQPVDLYMRGFKSGHIKFISNEIDIFPRMIKRHSFNPTRRDVSMRVGGWDNLNPYEDSHLFNWG